MTTNWGEWTSTNKAIDDWIKLDIATHEAPTLAIFKK